MADLRPVIETLENRWMRAWANGDAKTLKALTARNFRLVMGARPAAILDGPSLLDAARDRFLCDSYRFGDIYVRDVGAVAVFATQLTLRATLDGADWSGDYWLTDIWRKGRVRRQWRMVERILSRPDAEPRTGAGIKSLQLWR